MSRRPGGTALGTILILVAGCGSGSSRASDGGRDGGSPPNPVACASEPLRTTGQVTYYCDCQAGAAPGCAAGDDANEGTSPDAPRRTLGDAHARFGSMPAGGTVALCRGGAWNENGGMLENLACTVEDPCDYRDYVPSWATAETER